MNALTGLAGCRILVVEDDMMIAMHVEGLLQGLGCFVVGPVAKLDQALQLATDEVLDAAILDVTIRGGKAFPVAERLISRDIAFAFASGYGDWALPEIFRNRLRLTKPFTTRELVTLAQALCARSRAGTCMIGSPA